jgi:hypothetical protein
MTLRIKNTGLTIKIISWLQIIGGIAGLGLIAYLLLSTGTINGPVLLIFSTGIGLFSYSIYSGKSLLTDDNKKTGIILSIFNQAFQVIQWSMFGYAFVYSAGAELTIGLQETTFKFNITAFISSFQMSIKTDPEFLFKINLLPILVIYVLVDIFNELTDNSDEEKEIQVEELKVD